MRRKSATRSQIEKGGQGASQRPFVLAAPLTAMLQALLSVLAARATAHDKQLDRWIIFQAVVHPLEPPVKEPQP